MSAATDPSAQVLGEVALIACGRRKGKTRSCSSCERKAPILLSIARTGAVDALATAICGGNEGACRDCHDKARMILDETVTPCAACGEAGLYPRQTRFSDPAAPGASR
ncbi:hypothetical protein [Streptomyces mobaraensis]|uniref:Uncharacterized protein n=1 Tax=Streptomyces mobaraensis TaxID=35621 RepID=A0A5N5W358_STRMB|nr:hypothetical protein [Streptomyces mobaraensis]KAB7835793.1 hypothetical protein FRZ00_26650 [Streptomyces mobaraensis]